MPPVAARRGAPGDAAGQGYFLKRYAISKISKNGLQPGWRPPFGRVIADGVASADDAGRAGAWAAGERADRGAVAR